MREHAALSPPVPTRAVPSALRALPWVLTGVTILGQISWILVSARGRIVLTIITVISFFLASASHAAITRGVRWAAGYLAITLGVGLAVEALGTATGQPFGDYVYTDLLGPRIVSVPLLIPMAWAMMAYPCLLAVQLLTGAPRSPRGRVRTALVGGWLFAAWDLFLDPQMVGEGYWVWQHVGWALPGIPEIPLHNFAGWLLVAIGMMAALDTLPPSRADDRVPTVLLSWTYAGSVMAAAVFFGRPAVAAWGALAMGVVVIPWWLRLGRSR